MPNNSKPERDINEIWALAKQRANTYAPEPAYSPVSAGFVGMVTTGIVISIFLSIAGLDAARFNWAAGFTIALGFLIPFGYFKLEERKFYRAVSKEFEALNRERS